MSSQIDVKPVISPQMSQEDELTTDIDEEEVAAGFHSTPSSPAKAPVKKQPSPFPDLNSQSLFTSLEDEDDQPDKKTRYSPGFLALLRNTPSAAGSDCEFPDLDVALSQKPLLTKVMNSDEDKDEPEESEQPVDPQPHNPMDDFADDFYDPDSEPFPQAEEEPQPNNDRSPSSPSLPNGPTSPFPEDETVLAPTRSPTSPVADPPQPVVPLMEPTPTPRLRLKPKSKSVSKEPLASGTSVASRNGDQSTTSASTERSWAAKMPFALKRKSTAAPPDAEIIDVDDLSTPPATPEKPTKKLRRSENDAMSSSKRRRQNHMVDIAAAKGSKGDSDIPNEASMETEESPSSPQKQYTKQHRHPKYWFLDGSAVLQVPSGDSTMAFRLHRSTLIRKSSYMAKLLNTIPVGAVDGTPSYGIPVKLDLQLTDFEVLLDAIDDGITFASRAPKFHQLASLLRASTTLQFSALQKWALSRFTEIWDPSIYYEELGTAEYRQRRQAAETVILVKKLGPQVPELHALLKPAFYELLRMPEFGMQTLDAELESQSYAKVEKVTGKGKKSTRKKSKTDDLEPLQDEIQRLAPADLHRLIWARNRLTGQWNAALRANVQCKVMLQKPKTFSDDMDVSEGDGSHDAVPPIPTRCDVQLRSSWTTLIHDSGLFEEWQYDPISGLEQLRQRSQTWDEGIWCSACAEVYRRAWKLAKDKIWKNLDMWLALPTSD